MKRGILTLVMIFIGALIFAAVGAMSAAELPTKAPDVIIIDSKGYKKDTKGPVKFDHKKHSEEFINAENNKIPCTECHHDYKDGKNTWKEGDPVQLCTACHDPEKKQGNAEKLQLAFHKNCKECHQALIKAKLKKSSEAPTSCNKCMHD